MQEPTEPAAFVVGESFARILTATTQSLVCVLDPSGRIVLFNEACERATGFTREEVLGRDARDFVIPPEERDAFAEFLLYVGRTRSPAPQVGHWQAKDGSRRLIAWSNHPMSAGDGTLESIITTGIDLTDREAPPAESEDALAGDPEAKLAEVGRLATEQRELRRVATLVASEVTPERVFTAVSEGCARVLEVNASTVVRYEADGAALIVGRHNRDGMVAFGIGDHLPQDSATSRVFATGAPTRVDDWGGRTGAMAEAMLRTGYRSTAAVPIFVAGSLWGAVSIASETPLPADAEDRLGAFCELVSLAVASAQARADLIASRARLVKAGDEQRRRLERNLHDGAQQRLVSVALKLRVAKARLQKAPETVAELLDDASKELDTGLAELRELARGLHPAILADLGLPHALEGLASRVPVPVDVDAPIEGRLPERVEATAYYIVSEALANVAKHAGAEEARVTVRPDGAMLRVEVADDGRGGADQARGTGLVGLRDRAEAAGGRLTVASPPGRGTVVSAVLPISEPSR
jgi:PAS domain S-box-containing protein